MVRILFFLLSVFLFTACSKSEEQAIKQVETPANSSDNPVIIKEKNERNNSGENHLYLEFSLNEEVIAIDTSQISILNSYLQGSEDKEKELRDMQLRQLVNKKDKSLYLLQFACTKGACSYLLLSQGDQSHSYLAVDSARFRLAKLSPDQLKILLVFSKETQYQNYQLVQDKLIIMDLNEWKEIPYTEGIENDLNFTWPILHAEWKSDSSIEITLPDISSPDKDSLYRWNATDREIQKVQIEITEELN